MNTKNDNNLQELKGKIILQEKLNPLIKFDFSVLSPNWINVRCKEGEYIHRNGINSKTDVLEILQILPPANKKALLKFAGKDAIQTDGAFLLKITNFDFQRKPKAVLSYTSETGVEVWIDINANILQFIYKEKPINPHSNSKNPENFRQYEILMDGDLRKQVYGSASNANHFTYHGTNEAIINLFK